MMGVTLRLFICGPYCDVFDVLTARMVDYVDISISKVDRRPCLAYFIGLRPVPEAMEDPRRKMGPLG